VRRQALRLRGREGAIIRSIMPAFAALHSKW